MNAEHIEQEMSTALARLRKRSSQELRQQTIAAVCALRPTPARLRRRAVIAAVTTAVALIGLGFVPFPAGSARGALAKAVAAMVQGPAVFMEGKKIGEGDKVETYRVWHAPGGLWRDEVWRDGKLVAVNCLGPDAQISYDLEKRQGGIREMPPATLGLTSTGLPDRVGLQDLARQWQMPDQVTVEEWKERSLWGGVREFARFEDRTDSTRDLYELDPDTGRLIALTKYGPPPDGKGDWEPWLWTEKVEWDVKVPDGFWSAEDITPPKGMTVTVSRGGYSRVAAQTLAERTVGDWQVRLHLVEVHTNGDLSVWLSSLPTSVHPADPDWEVLQAEAVDDHGVRYTALPGPWRERGYWDYHLVRGETALAPGASRSVTIILHPTSRDGTVAEAEAIAFADIPLPPPSEDAGQWKGSTQTIKY